MGGSSNGVAKNDTWQSTNNGVTWTRMNASAGWKVRDSHSSVAMPDGSIVLMGGSSNGVAKNDVWRSTDNGTTWTQLPKTGWVRTAHSSVALPDGSIVLMGGFLLGGYFNDVWRFDSAGSTATNPSHIYTTPGIYTVTLQAYNGIGYNSTRKAGYITVTGTAIPSKIGVFRNSTHLFYLDYNGNGAWNGASVDRQYNFGITGDIPVTGDWNNDGISEIGVFRPSTHLFYLDYNGNGAWNGAAIDRQYNFGITGDIPITGDWNNDGISEIGVFRPSTHLFYMDYNGNGVWNGASVDRTYNFGITGDIPISGDWNSDGRTEIGVFRSSTHLFYLDFNGNGVWDGAVTDNQYNFGITGDIPVAGDWNQDGTSEIGVFRPSTHLFYLDYNGNGAWNGASIDRQYNFGITGDNPVTGSWS
jgi:PKD repeat protein